MPAATETAAPLLSAIIPVFNRRDLILRAIASVLKQRAQRACEVIVVDDGSTDGTADAVAQRFGTDARVRVLAGAHAGASAARNRGLRKARGDLVCFLDSDDYWLPGTLAAAENLFARDARLAFVSVDGATLATPTQPANERIVVHAPGWSHAQFARARLVRERVEGTALNIQRGDFFPAILFGDLFFLSGMVMRHSAAIAAGPFNERFRFFNDWEFFARLCLVGEGAHVDFDGFRRDSGRADQISRQRPHTAMARRQRYIVRTLARRGDTAAYAQTLRLADADACYALGRALLPTTHRRWATRYLLRCLRRHYKFFRTSALLLSNSR